MKKILIVVISVLFTTLIQAKETEWKINENEFNQLTIILKINKEDTECLLDTGSRSALSLPLEIINKIPNKIKKKDKLKSTDAIGNVRYTQQFVLYDFMVNDLFYKELDIDEYKLWGFTLGPDGLSSENYGVEFTCVVGFNLFSKHLLTIDIRDQKLIISDDFSTQLKDDWIQIPFSTTEKGHLLLSLTDNMKNYIFGLDSGASANLIMSQRLSKNIKLLRQEDIPYPIIELSYIDIPNKNEYFIAIDGFTEQMPFDGLLGYDFFYNNIVKIDYKHRKIWVKSLPKGENN
ncbi:hypothetical protein RHO14_04405 [Orbus wheelerorum]|uniref:hypothetical protein n=1 Tax=Orbus wheelerorum TaxID=3074111 RepID=UPI00370D9B4B